MNKADKSRIPLPHRLQLQPVGLCSIAEELGITVEEAAKKQARSSGFGKLRRYAEP